MKDFKSKIFDRISSLLLAVVTIAVGILGYVIFSAMGMLPKNFSVKVPPQIQTYSSELKYTGYSLSDTGGPNIKNKTVKTGALDSLHLFDNGNIFSRGYYDTEKDSYNINVTNKGSYRIALKKDFDGNFKKMTVHKRFNSGVTSNGAVFKSGRYYYSITDNKDVRLIYQKSKGFRYDDKKMNYSSEFDESEKDEIFKIISERLERQTKEEIPVAEFEGLLNAISNHLLLGWFPDEHIAVFRQEIEDGKFRIYRYDTQNQEILQNIIYPDYKYLLVCSAKYGVSYNEKSKRVTIEDLTTVEGITYLEVTDGIQALNYSFDAKGDLIIGIITLKPEVIFINFNKNLSITREADSRWQNTLLMSSKNWIIYENRYGEGGFDIYYNEMNFDWE